MTFGVAMLHEGDGQADGGSAGDLARWTVSNSLSDADVVPGQDEGRSSEGDETQRGRVRDLAVEDLGRQGGREGVSLQPRPDPILLLSRGTEPSGTKSKGSRWRPG